MGKESSGREKPSRKNSRQLRRIGRPAAESGPGEIIYKFMPFGEVYRSELERAAQLIWVMIGSVAGIWS
jgi:hypothetical protein